MFVTTHSPFVLYEMDNVNLVRIYSERKINSISTFYKVPDAYEKNRKMLNRCLSEAIFANKVLLVEGPSEYMLFSKVLSVVHPFYEVDGIYILPVDGVGFETYFSILDELEIFNVVKTDNDLRAVTGKGTYSVLGFSRCNNYIGEKRLPTKQIQENSVSAKRSLYNSNINTLDKIRSDFHIFLSKVDLENDLDEFLHDRLSALLDNDNPVKYLSNIVPDKKSALLRFSNDNARIGASELTTNGLEYVYIPQTPIADITTDTAWLYTAIAKYLIIEKYSAYDVISEIPVEGNESRKTVSTVKRLLKRIEETIDDEQSFGSCVTALAEYLGYDTRPDHINKLFKTISDTSFHVAFEADKYKHIAITFHSSKGLEFEQVIVFAEDYRLSDMSSIYNHYVAVTRAKSKLIIVKLNNYNANCFQNNLQKIFSESGHNIEDVVLF